MWYNFRIALTGFSLSNTLEKGFVIETVKLVIDSKGASGSLHLNISGLCPYAYSF